MKTIIHILFDDITIGAVQTIKILDHNNERPQLLAEQIRLDRMRLGDIFSKSFVHPYAQSKPLQIIVKEDDKEVIKFNNVWFQKLATSFTTDDFVIVNIANLEAEYISGLIKSS